MKVLEGGWYDGAERRDPNPTNFGVTQSTYDNYRRAWGLGSRSVRHITMPEVHDIYLDYWANAGGRELPFHTAVAVFDHGINAGPNAAIKRLQLALGFKAKVDVDGVIGPATRLRVLQVYPVIGDRALAQRVCNERLAHYYDLALRSPRLRPNLTSWVGRLVQFDAQYPQSLPL